MKTIITKNEEETRETGRKTGETCQGGEVFLLYGELGSGKTQFSKGLAWGLGIKAHINSPTFNIMKVYKIRGKKIKYFCHIDAYRLDNKTNLENIGIDEYLGKKDVVTVIEWPDKIEKLLEKGCCNKIKIEVIDHNIRKIVKL